MRLSRTVRTSSELPGGMTAFVDVIFQLVLFFIFSLRFLSFQGELAANLPKEGGPPPDDAQPLVSLGLWLDWAPENGGMVTCTAPVYYPGDGNSPVDDYAFPMAPDVREVGVLRGEPRVVSNLTMENPKRGVEGTATYDYRVPDFRRIEDYLKARKAYYDRIGVSRGPSVTVHTNGPVPWEMPVQIFDICTRVGISDFALSAPEAES